MVGAHAAAMTALDGFMTALRRVKESTTIDGMNSYGNLANKLLRTYTAQVEALSRYRGKGQQTVRRFTFSCGPVALACA
jgi:hypothetical protein